MCVKASAHFRVGEVRLGSVGKNIIAFATVSSDIIAVFGVCRYCRLSDYNKGVGRHFISFNERRYGISLKISAHKIRRTTSSSEHRNYRSFRIQSDDNCGEIWYHYVVKAVCIAYTASLAIILREVACLPSHRFRVGFKNKSKQLQYFSIVISSY